MSQQKSMRIALIADVFPPLRSSGAVQLRDLALELVRQGHRPTVMVPSPGQARAWQVEDMQGVEVVRLRGPQTKDVGYARRTMGEFVLPYMMLRHLRSSPLASVRWDGVIWYSPTIFLGPIAKALKVSSSVKGYLIIRDLFPEWAVNMGLLSRFGLPHLFFKAVERYQYSVADVIGVQTPANLPYFSSWSSRPERRLEVLQNWLAVAPEVPCSIQVQDGPLKGRKIFVYAGNMGIAQGIDVLVDLAQSLAHRPDVGFLFVGRGSHAQHLRLECERRGLGNTGFHDEIDPSEIPALYAQCHVGLVSLDPRHKTHNVPGKFLTYMQGGLPVLARVNPGNDMVDLIQSERVGRVTADQSIETLKTLAESLIDEVGEREAIRARCLALSERLFSAEVAVKQVIRGLTTQSA